MAKKRRRRDRARETVEREPAPAHIPTERMLPEPRLPSTFARIAGAVLAVVTVVIAVLTVVSGLSGDVNPVDSAVRLFVGLLLIALAIVIAALAIVPRFVQRVIAGR
jgi:hypothetical protein